MTTVQTPEMRDIAPQPVDVVRLGSGNAKDEYVEHTTTWIDVLMDRGARLNHKS